MNERIKELAIQTDIWCDQNLAQGSPMYNNQWEQKFAELIVFECSKIIVNGGYRNPALGEKYPLTPPEIATMIKEHSGVAE